MKVTHLVIRRERPGGKLKPRYIGPYRILRRIEPLVYCLELYLELSQIHDVFHVSMLKWYILDPSHNLEAPPIRPNEDLLFEVQSAVIDNQGMKQLRSKVIFLIKFFRGVIQLKKWLGRRRHLWEITTYTF